MKAGPEDRQGDDMATLATLKPCAPPISVCEFIYYTTSIGSRSAASRVSDHTCCAPFARREAKVDTDTALNASQDLRCRC